MNESCVSHTKSCGCSILFSNDPLLQVPPPSLSLARALSLSFERAHSRALSLARSRSLARAFSLLRLLVRSLLFSIVYPSLARSPYRVLVRSSKRALSLVYVRLISIFLARSFELARSFLLSLACVCLYVCAPSSTYSHICTRTQPYTVADTLNAADIEAIIERCLILSVSLSVSFLCVFALTCAFASTSRDLQH